MELYCMTHSMYFIYLKKKPNVAMLCWDAVATALIAYPVFMYHVSFICEKGKLRGGERLGHWRREMRV